MFSDPSPTTRLDPDPDKRGPRRTTEEPPEGRASSTTPTPLGVPLCHPPRQVTPVESTDVLGVCLPVQRVLSPCSDTDPARSSGKTGTPWWTIDLGTPILVPSSPDLRQPSNRGLNDTGVFPTGTECPVSDRGVVRKGCRTHHPTRALVGVEDKRRRETRRRSWNSRVGGQTETQSLGLSGRVLGQKNTQVSGTVANVTILMRIR